MGRNTDLTPGSWDADVEPTNRSENAIWGSMIRVFVAWIAMGVLPASAQLQVTEVLLDPLTTGDKWEWIEVFNSGSTDVDLKDYYAARIDDVALATGAPPSIDASAQQTIVPAGGVAVLYAGDLGTAVNNFRDDLFRTAWDLAPTTTVVGVKGFPALTNAGTAFGFWPTRADYDADVADVGGSSRVGGFAHAAFSLDYRTDFPLPEGASIRWNGMGDNQDAVNWAVSSADQPGIVASTPLFSPGTTLGSPGIVPEGTAATGLLITEVMYNPVDSEPAWEWVEVLNNTGADIDFSTSAYVLDDNAGGPLTSANITSGAIAQGGVAVLYNDALTRAKVTAAWDPGNARGVNFVPVANFSTLNNTSDTIGIWESLASYASEAVTGANRTTGNARAALSYASGTSLQGGVWPTTIKGRSIFLADLTDNSAVGENWSLSAEGVGDAFFIATESVIYSGGDVGDPGLFRANSSGAPGDLDNDGDADDQDFVFWEGRFGGSSTGKDLGAWEAAFGGDAFTDDGASFLAIQRQFGEIVVGGNALTGADFLLWQRAYDPPATIGVLAVPEPAPVWIALAGCLVTYARRNQSLPGSNSKSFHFMARRKGSMRRITSPF